MVNDEVTFICQQCHQSVDHEPQAELLPRWHPNGPYFDFFPYPIVDVTRPWRSPCDSCGSQCTGHFVTNIQPLLEMRKNNKAIRSLPPGIIISEEAFKKGSSENDKVALAKKCCLSTEEVEIWLCHLQKKQITRAKGVQKAKQTPDSQE